MVQCDMCFVAVLATTAMRNDERRFLECHGDLIPKQCGSDFYFRFIGKIQEGHCIDSQEARGATGLFCSHFGNLITWQIGLTCALATCKKNEVDWYLPATKFTDQSGTEDFIIWMS